MDKPAGSVAIIGGGKMGGDIAVVFAAGGWQAHVQEPDARVRAALPQRWRAALGTARAARMLHVHETLDALPWPDIALVIETVPENLALKQALFRKIEALARPAAILASNSSSFRISEIATKLRRPQRAAGMHWGTPAHIAPIVEVVRGKATSTRTMGQINRWLRALGKLPVNLSRDITGMLVNRMQHAMMREAFALIDRGIATPQDIDLAVRYGYGFRYIAAGPLRQRDMNGLVIHREAAAQIYPTLHNGAKPPRCLERLLAAGHTGARAGRGFYRWDPRKLEQELARCDALFWTALELMADSGNKGRRKPRAARRAG
jgi:3-hydroxybutyryl-CoA dehydrogenase